MLTNKRVFVSGGNGVIGKELVKGLTAAGAKIMVGDLKPFSPDLSPDICYRQGDLNYVTARELNQFQPEYFFHLAATFERSVETYEFWEENYWHNVKLSHHLMTLLKDCPTLKRVIFASSYLIYDQQLYQFDAPQKMAYRLTENDPIYPRNLTGMAKLMHEMELEFLQEFRGQQFSMVMPRIFRVYGKGSRDVVSRWVRMLLNKQPLEVYNPEGLFDYIYAGDVAQGLLRLATSDVQGVINLGKDQARRVEEVIAVLQQHFSEMIYTNKRVDMPFEASQANMEYFQAKVNWLPPTSLEDGIGKLIAYELQQQRLCAVEQIGNVLVTSASKKIPLLQAVKVAMAKLGGVGKLICADRNPHCLARYYADEFWQMPDLDQLADEVLLTQLKERQVGWVIPTRDGELLFWSQRQQMLKEKGIGVMVAGSSAVENCLDKLGFYQRCGELSIPAILTSDKLVDISGDNLVVKDRFGAGARQMGLGLTRAEAQKFATGLMHPIFQPFISGKEFSVDAYLDQRGRVKGLVCRTRDLVVDGESQVTTTVVRPDLAEKCVHYLEKLGLIGHVVLQLLEDEHGDVHIIECNSRFGGASTLSLAAGLDSFYWFLLESKGVDIASYPFMKQEQQLRQVRHPSDRIIPVGPDQP